MYAHIKVRSGGIFLRNTENHYGSYTIINKTLNNAPESFLQIIRKDSILGLIAYLLGERAKLASITNNPTLDSLISRVKIKVHGDFVNNDNSVGNLQIMYERKDLVYDSKSLTPEPKINLHQFDWDQSFSIIKLLKDDLISITGKKTLAEVHEHFVTAHGLEKKKYDKCKKSQNLSYFNNAISLNDKFTIPVETSQNKNGITLLNKINEKIDKYISRTFDDFNKLPFYDEYTMLIRALKNKMSTCQIRLEDFDSSKWSVFDSSLNQPRHWIRDDLKTFVKGAPSYLLNVDFDIFIDNLTDEEVSMFKNGPRTAYWAEGGVALLNVNNDTAPASDLANNFDYTFPVKEIKKSIREFPI